MFPVRTTPPLIIFRTCDRIPGGVTVSGSGAKPRKIEYDSRNPVFRPDGIRITWSETLTNESDVVGIYRCLYWTGALTYNACVS